ncbi:hypothetical protein ANANG_G00242630 [Anguilla anguilla]|uniref:Uncharacterized protein n=1 Tax=Anguilla anguilla TaxID=7936 RepID=A0A9D3LQY2_ANGAN|nr:hypothetical protein ANANG_G00242630 [Anguilla anguilla]
MGGDFCKLSNSYSANSNKPRNFPNLIPTPLCLTFSGLCWGLGDVETSVWWKTPSSLSALFTQRGTSAVGLDCAPLAARPHAPPWPRGSACGCS